MRSSAASQPSCSCQTTNRRRWASSRAVVVVVAASSSAAATAWHECVGSLVCSGDNRWKYCGASTRRVAPACAMISQHGARVTKLVGILRNRFHCMIAVVDLQLEWTDISAMATAHAPPEAKPPCPRPPGRRGSAGTPRVLNVSSTRKAMPHLRSLSFCNR